MLKWVEIKITLLHAEATTYELGLANVLFVFDVHFFLV